MKISENYKKFIDRSALIIVSAEKAADLYAVFGGEISLIAEIKAPELHYSDKEGRFGKELGGAPQSKLEEGEKKAFSEELEKYLDNNWKDEYKEVFILTTKQDKNTVMDVIPPQAKKITVADKFGNYTKATPFEILEILTHSV